MTAPKKREKSVAEGSGRGRKGKKNFSRRNEGVKRRKIETQKRRNPIRNQKREGEEEKQQKEEEENSEQKQVSKKRKGEQ